MNRARAIKWVRSLGMTLLLLAAAVNVHAAAEEARPRFDVVVIDSAITPPVAEYIIASVAASSKAGSEGLIIQMDTPGGLDLAMRDIIKSLLNAPLPVIVYVAPKGARAASAGAFITVAAHIAAMAPGTNIGAAHPVAIGAGKMDETMLEKVESDAVAYARSIAKERGRNADWMEKAVRKSASIPAEEALSLRVIDAVAGDLNELLEKIDGREVHLPSGKRKLRARGAEIQMQSMGIRERILITISNPNIAYLLFIIGLAGLYFEFAHPGVVLPGIVGGISLILAFFAFQTLPINYAGILLILFAVILFIAEIKVMSHGVLTIGGVVSFALGSIMLFESPDPAIRVSWSVLIPAVLVTSLFFAGVIALAVKAQLRKPLTGQQGMIGEYAQAVTDVGEEGKVFLKGEYWNAFSSSPIKKDSRVRVVAIRGLVLEVEPSGEEKKGG
ncbi:MAG TPA: nodulation protein NfeD [Syntrophales bacterium]|nr:nodulation protein NfeD [Syntrophales bacterium]HPI55850.1 nodulation protein NfeD [Syntrophales bacterium]HPN23659.1 nodulation protein NfeD [Syntrophales bacterium]HQM27816.1 nodulation protein NfeD [Syntrophales bacterium]